MLTSITALACLYFDYLPQLVILEYYVQPLHELLASCRAFFWNHSTDTEHVVETFVIPVNDLQKPYKAIKM